MTDPSDPFYSSPVEAYYKVFPDPNWQPEIVLPPGVVSRCHMCQPPKDFKSIDDCSRHMTEIHRTFKS
jgi:hypothetical protein